MPTLSFDRHSPEEVARQAVVDELNLSAFQAEESFDRVTRLLARITHAPMAAFSVLDGDRQFFPSVVGLDLRETARSVAFCEYTIAQDEVLIVEDAQKDPRFADNPLVTQPPYLRFYAAVPVRGRGGHKVGALCVLDTQPRSLSDSERASIDDLRALIEDKLKATGEQARDVRTGVYTRRYFDEAADREWRRALRGMVPISVVLASLDHLEAFGAAEGEDALQRGLRAAGLALQYTLLRPGDVACRYEDNWFAILLPGTNEQGAVETVERIRTAVGALQIPFQASEMGVLTLSLGIETVPSESLGRVSLEAAMAAARSALERSQAGGGNRWTLSPSAEERWRKALRG